MSYSFQPGEGPSRGLLHDCTNRLWNRWIDLRHYLVLFIRRKIADNRDIKTRPRSTTQCTWYKQCLGLGTISFSEHKERIMWINWPDINTSLTPALQMGGPAKVLHTTLYHAGHAPHTPPLKKAIPQLRGPLFSLKPLSERTPTDSEYDVGWFKTTQNFWDIYTNVGFSVFSNGPPFAFWLKYRWQIDWIWCLVLHYFTLFYYVESNVCVNISKVLGRFESTKIIFWISWSSFRKWL